MKQATKALKLKLNRDTLRLLDKHELTVAEGRGNTFTLCQGGANSGCPNHHSCLC